MKTKMKNNILKKIIINIITIIFLLNICSISIASNISKIPATEIISELTLNEGEVGRIARIWIPSNTTDKITWTSSDTKIVTVDTNGNVKAIKQGIARIKAQMNSKVYAAYTIKVNKKDSNGGNNSNSTPGTNTKKVKINGHTVNLPEGNDRVYFLDVTDYRSNVKYNYDGSDAIILESNGKFAMIDTGIDYQGSRVVNYLKSLGATNLEFILITHAHIDHYGGFNKIINSGIKVKKLYIKNISNGKSDRIYAYRNIINNAKSRGIQICNVSEWENQRFTLEDYYLSLYNTSDVLKNKASSYEVGENVNSVAVLAQIHNRKIYFSGDIESDPSIKCYPDLEVIKSIGVIDVYKFPHHSYPTYNYESILKKLNPQYGIVTNQKNRYGTVHSRNVAIRNTRINSNSIYYTGNGTVIMTVQDNGNIKFNQLSNDG